MELNDVQKQAVRDWAGKGMGLSEIQKNIQTEFGISLTYMDVRFLVLDLECSIKDRETKPEPKVDAAADEEAIGTGMPGMEESGGMPGGGVKVELDRVVKAGAVISGTVVFSDGVSAAWAVDNLGRMVLDAGNPDYRPSQEDVQLFQMELKNLVEKRGY